MSLVMSLESTDIGFHHLRLDKVGGPEEVELSWVGEEGGREEVKTREMRERVVGDEIFSDVGHGSAGETGVGGFDEEGGC